jgi:hypothetical protein
VAAAEPPPGAREAFFRHEIAAWLRAALLPAVVDAAAGAGEASLALRAAGFPPGGGAFFTGAKVTLQGGERSAEERAAACSRVCAAVRAAYAAQSEM